MIIFKKISYKNFLSTGNLPIVIDLCNSKVTVVSGKNGNGKSSLAEAIFFAIYGKSFRKVNKDSLVNSINKKNLLVELDIDVNGTPYKIKRGIKPNIFEIYVNGKLKPQNASVKDYQKWLMTVLHMDERTFKQVVTMGSSSFTPFMRLTAAERRTVIEDLLNIDIISVMNGIAKTRASSIEKERDNVLMRLHSTEFNLNSIQSSASSIKESIDDAIARTNKQLSDIKNEAESIIGDIHELKKKSNNERYKELTDLSNKIKKLISDGNQLLYKKNHALALIEKDIAFFNDNTECPYCTQKLDNEFIANKEKELSKKQADEQAAIDTVNKNIEMLNEKLNNAYKEMNELYAIEAEITKKYEEIEALKKKIAFFSNERSEYLKKKKREDTVAKDVINNIKKQIEELKEKSEQLSSKLKSYETIFALLKDDGIKTVIIKNYLGIINSLIKKYLNIIGYNVMFSFDTNFNETIKSRGRDTFEYNCFSEGERLRIDFCLLFAFRELAKLRSTVSTNLLIVDEQDGRLDPEGVAAINMLLSSMNGNLVVISQYAEIYDEIATRHILMEKEHHFTKAVVL